MTKAKEISIEGLKKDEALTLLIQGGMDFKEASQYWKDNSTARSAGFAGDYYKELESGVMSDDRFEEVITSGSDNVQKHKSHYNAIRLMANRIHGEA